MKYTDYEYGVIYMSLRLVIPRAAYNFNLLVVIC